MIPPAMIDAAFVPERSPDVAWVELESEVVAYHEPSSTTVVLNPTGALLWTLLDGRTTLAELAGALADEYEAPRAAIEEDLVAAAREFGSRGLLAGVGEEPATKG